MIDYIHTSISLFSILLNLYIINQFRKYYIKQPFRQNKVYLSYLISLCLVGLCYFLILIIEQDLSIYVILAAMNIFFCSSIVLISAYTDIVFFQRTTFFTYLTIFLSAVLISVYFFETPMDFLVAHKIEYITYNYAMKTRHQLAEFLTSQTLLLISTVRLFVILHRLTKKISTEYHFSSYLIFLGFFLKFPGFFLGYLLSEKYTQLSMIFLAPLVVIAFSTSFFLKKPYPFVFLRKNMTHFALLSENRIIYCFRIEDFKKLHGSELEQFDHENSMYLKNIPQMILKNEQSSSISFQLDGKRMIMAIGKEFTTVFLLKEYNPSYNDLAKWCLDLLQMKKFQSEEFWFEVRKLMNLLI